MFRRSAPARRWGIEEARGASTQGERIPFTALPARLDHEKGLRRLPVPPQPFSWRSRYFLAQIARARVAPAFSSVEKQ